MIFFDKTGRNAARFFPRVFPGRFIRLWGDIFFSKIFGQFDLWYFVDKTGRNAARFSARVFWGVSWDFEGTFVFHKFLGNPIYEILWIKQGEMLPVFLPEFFRGVSWDFETFVFHKFWHLFFINAARFSGVFPGQSEFVRFCGIKQGEMLPVFLPEFFRGVSWDFEGAFFRGHLFFCKFHTNFGAIRFVEILWGS